jgi:hypothetical protein
MKQEVGSLAFSDIVKQLTEKASEDCQVRKLFQSVLYKTVSEHDISKNECFKIISAEPYVKFSRPFRMLNLTGTRRLNLEQAGPAMDTNFCDLFWARKSDPNFLILVEMFESGLLDSDENPNNISLYKFTSSYTDKWKKSKFLYVPHSTPSFKYVPIPENEEFRKVYCEVNLLLHNPDCDPSRILGVHENAEIALRVFVDDPKCPAAVREDYLRSLKQKCEDPFKDVEDLVASPQSNDEHFDQDDWMKGLGVNVLPTYIDDEEPVNDDQSDIDDAYIGQTDDGFDWWQDALDLDITSIQMKDVHDWVKVQKLKTNVDHSEEATIDVSTLNEEQIKVFNVVKDSVDKYFEDIQDQKLVDMSRGARTGKSYVIKAIMQYAHDISGHRNLVKVAAPTGNAASLFSGGETLHAMLKIPAEKWFSEPLEDLVGEPLADLQKKFKDTQVLIIDEKGMVGWVD